MGEILGFLLALGITAAAIPLLARAARGWGLLAQPGPRMTHEGAVPTVGGLAMGVAFLAAYAFTGLAASLSPLLAAAVAITLAGGVLGDRHELRSLPKFGFPITAAAPPLPRHVDEGGLVRVRGRAEKRGGRGGKYGSANGFQRQARTSERGES